MTVVQLLDDLQRDGVTVSLADGALKLSGPRDKLDPARVQMLRARKADIERHLAEKATSFPLSQGQLGIHLAERIDPLHRPYNVMFGVRLRPGLEPAGVQAAWHGLVQRHAQLSRRYVEEGDGVMACASEHLPVLQVETRAGRDHDALREVAVAWAAAAFDLEFGPCLRACLWTDDAAPVLAITVHHIAADLSCLAILCRDLSALLRKVALPPPRHSFDDFVAAERRWLQSEAARSAALFWQSALPAPLPAWQWPPASIDGRGEARLRQDLGAAASGEILRLARTHAVSPFVVFLTAYQIVLSRYAGQPDIVIGAAVSNRPGPDYAATIGDFTNLIPFALTLGEASYAELLAHSAAHLAEAMAHARLPFRDIVRGLEAGGAPHRPMVLQATMSWHAGAPAIADDVITGIEFSISQSGAPCDLTVAVSQSGESFVLDWQWHPRVLDRASVATLSGTLQRFMAHAAAAPTHAARALPLLEPAERHRQIVGLNDTARALEDVGIAALVSRQAAARPTRCALRTTTGMLTYAALESGANRLAHHLRRHGVAAGTVMGICLDRGSDFVLAALAALKLGAAYAPIDPALPASRQRLMIDTARMVLIVTRAPHAAPLEVCGAPCLLLDAHAAEIAACPDAAPAVAASPEDAAYVIHTSGSTGVPKGVVVTHRNVVRLIDAMGEYVGDSDVVLHAANPAFDASTFEIWCALARGATCAILPPGGPDLVALERFIGACGVSVAFLTTALFNTLVTERIDALAPLRVLLFGGEAVSRKHVVEALRHLRTTRLFHVYGPTECTTFATAWPVRHRPDRAIPIGRPIANTQAYILDDLLAPLPRGATGQLYLGGAGVAQAYLGDADLTARRFIIDPFGGGGRLYRTGDLARLLHDDTIDFVGRADDQIKLRGFRIELEEVRTALLGVPGVEDAVVMLAEGQGGLAAYAVAPGAEAQSIRTALAASLPDYMIPSRIVLLDHLPLTPSGKVDRRRLAADETACTAPVDPPHPGLEARIAALFSDLLGARDIGRQSDFFALGGCSLKASQLAARLQGAAGAPVDIATIMRARTVAAIGAAIEIAGKKVEQPC